MLARPSSWSSDAVREVGVDLGSGVVVRLGVGSGGDVGGSDGFVSVLEEVRVEGWPVQVQLAALAAVFRIGRRRSSPKYSVCDRMRRVVCSLDG